MRKLNRKVFIFILLSLFASLLFAQEVSMVNAGVRSVTNSNNADLQRSRELYQLDDGSSEEAIGYGIQSDFMALNGFEAIAGSETIGYISIAWGTPGEITSPYGHITRLILYDDPTNDWDPSDAVYLTEVSSLIYNPDTDIFTTVAIPPTMVSGVFYVASLYENDSFYPCSLDMTSSQSSSWFVVTSPGTLDVNDLGNPSYDYPLDLIDNYGYPGNWLLRADSIIPPEIEVTPLSFDINLESGEMDTQILAIENTGEADLNYIITKEIASGERTESDISTNSNSRDIGDILGDYGDLLGSSSGIVLIDNLFYSIDLSSFQLDVFDPVNQIIIASYPLHPVPFSITWDGTYLWIGDINGDVFSYNLDGTPTGDSFSCPFTNYPTLTWDGNYFIVNQIYIPNPTFYRLDNTGAVIDMFTSSFGEDSNQIVWVPEHENGHLWSCDYWGSNVSQFNLDSNSGTAQFITQFTPPDADEIYSITHDSFDLWLKYWNGSLYKIDDGINEGWLYCNPTNGIIAQENTSYINVTFDASNLSDGIYEANLHIINNDYDEGYFEIPVILTVGPPIEAEAILLAITQLHQNHPNPFNPTTTISFDLVNTGKITLNVYNIKGELVRTLASENYPAGQNSILWNGEDNNGSSVSSGIYFYSLKAGDHEETKKMILMK